MTTTETNTETMAETETKAMDGDETTSTIICCSDELRGSGCFHWLIVAVLTDQPECSLQVKDQIKNRNLEKLFNVKMS